LTCDDAKRRRGKLRVSGSRKKGMRTGSIVGSQRHSYVPYPGRGERKKEG